ncbi:MAG: AAA family ATPase [Thermoguttaceae bacterium]
MAKIKYVSGIIKKADLSIICNADPILKEYANAGYRVTLRQLHYQFVSRGYLPNTDKTYDCVCTAMQHGRMAGLIDWDIIEDRTRILRSRPRWDDPSDLLDCCADQFHVDYWQDQPRRVEVWIEKDALLGDDAFWLLQNQYNPRCQPQWSDKEIRHKIAQVHEHPPEHPRGRLLENTCVQTASKYPGIDISRIANKIGVTKMPTAISNERPESRFEVQMIPASQIEKKPINWLLKDMIALGSITVFVGRPGVGKSFLTCFLASQVTSSFPCYFRDRIIPQSSTIMVNTEAPETVIVQRLENHGATTSKIFFPKVVANDLTKEGEVTKTEVPLTLEMIAYFRSMFEQTPDCKMIILDPVSALYGEIKEHSNTEIRAVLSQLKALAEEHEIAIVLITHTNKSISTDSSNRTHGSRGLAAAARSVWFVVEDDTGLKTVCCDKNNLSENKNGFTYRLENSAVMIIDESVETTASTELAKESRRLHSTGDTEKIGRPTLELDEAVDFVLEIMKEGTRSVSDIKAEASAAGLSWTTVKRARSKAGYEAVRTETGWAWRPAFWMTDTAQTHQQF